MTEAAAAGVGARPALPEREGPQLIVAVAQGGAIGAGGTLPWHIPEDLAHFKAVTLGHTLVMGAATWASIGRPLPGRRTIVVSRGLPDVPDGVFVAASPGEALEIARRDDPSPFIVGGAQIFEALAARAVRLWRTDLDLAVPDADVFWPADPPGMVEVASWAGDDPRVTFRVLDRFS